jgi:hypothetical protein
MQSKARLAMAMRCLQTGDRARLDDESNSFRIMIAQKDFRDSD